MSSDVEPAKKVLLPYLQRADELQKHEPLIAYYCRLYAMERGLKIPNKERTKTTNAILISLMSQLEKDKKTIQVSPEDNLYVEGFALSVFAKADKQDRAGQADLSTAKTFYAASIFIEILHQFGSLQPDIEQKQKYAVWKAADIRKAVSEGRKPIPGPPGGDEDSLMSPDKPVDSVEEKHPIHHTPSVNSEDLNPPANARLDTSSSQGAPLDHQDYQVDHTRPQQPHHDLAYARHTQSGYAGYYPSVYHPSSTPDTTVAPSFAAGSPHGWIDHHNSQLHTSNSYPGFTQVTAGGHMYPSSPSAYAGSHEGSDAAYYQSQPQGSHPNAANYSAPTPVWTDSSSGPQDSSGLGRTTSAPLSADMQITAYHPSPEKIAEAQKAARFGVSALAFDDVPTAVSYLKQALELLANPAI